MMVMMGRKRTFWCKPFLCVESFFFLACRSMRRIAECFILLFVLIFINSGF